MERSPGQSVPVNFTISTDLRPLSFLHSTSCLVGHKAINVCACNPATTLAMNRIKRMCLLMFDSPNIFTSLSPFINNALTEFCVSIRGSNSECKGIILSLNKSQFPILRNSAYFVFMMQKYSYFKTSPRRQQVSPYRFLCPVSFQPNSNMLEIRTNPLLFRFYPTFFVGFFRFWQWSAKNSVKLGQV